MEVSILVLTRQPVELLSAELLTFMTTHSLLNFSNPWLLTTEKGVTLYKVHKFSEYDRFTCVHIYVYVTVKI